MRQFLLADARSGAEVELAGADYHYLVRVRRMAAGAGLTVVDAAGCRYAATVTEVANGVLRLSIGGPLAANGGRHRGTCALTLIQALPQGALMDRIVRQATELGVAAIVPVVATRTQGRVAPAAAARKRARWQRIARQAVQQSGAVPPAIGAPLALRRYLEQRTPAAMELLFHPGAAPLQEVLEREPRAQPATEVRCAVGPEGGFSAAERELFHARGFRSVGLQAGVLRVDTAAVAALAAVGQLLAAPPDNDA
jgi:16S rRNA (uracil1498-N3)-methyltransferase